MKPGHIQPLPHHLEGDTPGLPGRAPPRRNTRNTVRQPRCAGVFRGKHTQNTGNTEKRMDLGRWGLHWNNTIKSAWPPAGLASRRNGNGQTVGVDATHSEQVTGIR